MNDSTVFNHNLDRETAIQNMQTLRDAGIPAFIITQEKEHIYTEEDLCRCKECKKEIEAIINTKTRKQGA